MNYLELLRSQFNDRIEFREKRPGIVQLIAPLYHEDGDLMEIFIEPIPDGRIRVCDHGLTLMRLSYAFELDTPNKERVFRRMLAENMVQEERGNLHIDASPDGLYAAVMQFAQTISKVSSMSAFRREVMHSLFAEMLGEFVEESLARYHPQPAYCPIPGHQEYEIDWALNDAPRPDFLCGVNSVAKARLTIIAFLKFQAASIPFRGLAVLENIDIIEMKDQARLMSAADKVFPSLDDFREHAESFLDRERRRRA